MRNKVMKYSIVFVLVLVPILMLMPSVVFVQGRDHSCFLPGTKITMADGSFKNIEDVEVGDKVLSFDENLNPKTAIVQALDNPIRDHHYIISLKNGKFLNVTREHPLYFKSENFEGWGAIEPKYTPEEYGFLPEKINVGNQLITQKKDWVEIINMEYIEGDVQTYNLIWVSDTNTFFADGFLAHNRDHDQFSGISCTNQGHPVCGSFGCESGETCSSCPSDCGVSNAGSSCQCDACGCGTINSCGTCTGGLPAPSNYGQACGNCGTIGCSGTCVDTCVDIGLRIYDGTSVVSIAAEPLGSITSPLRIAEGGNVYGIVLVDPGHPKASKIRIQTKSGVKALRKIG